jgi:hypothetical protein
MIQLLRREIVSGYCTIASPQRILLAIRYMKLSNVCLNEMYSVVRTGRHVPHALSVHCGLRRGVI